MSLLPVNISNTSRDVASFGLGPPPPPIFFFKYYSIYIYIYICALNLAILFYKITFFPLNNIIDSFKNNVILTNFFTNCFGSKFLLVCKLLMPGLDRIGKLPSSFRSTTRHGDAPMSAGLIGGPS